jgi:hypothetical protein
VKKLRVVLILALTSSGVVMAAEPLRIGRITVDARPIFDSAEAAGGFYRVANLLHIQTRAALLRRFLLFREGDPYDPVKLEETERNLRLFDFLVSASVTASPPHDGVVDVAVVTQDSWTTNIDGDFSNEGGIAAYDVNLTQKDLFGTGGELQLRHERGVERDGNAIELLHPAALGPYWNLDALYAKNSDGNEEKLALERPFFSYTTAWTASVLLDHLLQNERIFQEGQVAARFGHEHRELAFSHSHLLHADRNGRSSIVGGIDLLDDTFSHLPGRSNDVIPVGRHFRFLDIGYESAGFRMPRFRRAVRGTTR